MSFQTIPDVPLLITVPGLTADALPLVSSERRITPAWTISLFKGKMEPITGIPPSCQRPKLRSPGREDVWIEGNEERQLAEWIPYGLVRGAEIEVSFMISYPHFGLEIHFISYFVGRMCSFVSDGVDIVSECLVPIPL